MLVLVSLNKDIAYNCLALFAYLILTGLSGKFRQVLKAGSSLKFRFKVSHPLQQAFLIWLVIPGQDSLPGTSYLGVCMT